MDKGRMVPITAKSSTPPPIPANVDIAEVSIAKTDSPIIVGVKKLISINRLYLRLSILCTKKDCNVHCVKVSDHYGEIVMNILEYESKERNLRI